MVYVAILIVAPALLVVGIYTIQNVRGYFNAVVRDFNTRIAQFPSNIVAGMFHFIPRDFFEITAPAERDVPKLSFGATIS